MGTQNTDHVIFRFLFQHTASSLGLVDDVLIGYDIKVLGDALEAFLRENRSAIEDHS